MKQLIIAIALILAVITSYSEARTFARCKGGFVGKGDPLSEVISECGLPIYVDEETGGGAKTKRETWYYAKKSFKIRNGKVVGVETRLK